MAKVECWFKQDLKKPVKVQTLNGNVFTLDNVGSLIGVEVYDNGSPATLSGSVNGYIILPDDTTVSVAGTRSGNKVSINLPQSALAIPGFIKIAVKLTNSSEITTLLAVVATVYKSRTDTIITPSQQIITDWSQQISASLQQNADLVAQSVKYGSSQSLTDAQKQTARTNIGAVSTAELEAETTAREAADSDIKQNLNGLDEVLKITRRVPYSTASSYRLKASGVCVNNQAYELIKYSVTPGDQIYIRTKTNNISDSASYQFQTNPSVGTTENTYLVGSPQLVGHNGIVTVPATANYIIISALKTDDIVCGVFDVEELDNIHERIDEQEEEIAVRVEYVKRDADSISTGWKLLSSGLGKSINTYNLLKYTVTEGDKIFIKTPQPESGDASYQFQSESSVSATSNPYIIGSPVLVKTNEIVTVPAGAKWLIISALISDTNNGIFVIPGIDEIKEELTDCVKYELTVPDATVNGWKIRSDGNSQQVSTYKMIKYAVKEGHKIFVVAPEPLSGNASYQFQTNSSVPASNNTYIVGSPVLTGVKGYVTVPSTATWLIISTLKTDTESGVYKVPETSEPVEQTDLIVSENTDATNKIFASRWLRSTTATPLTMLWFSDIHRDKTALERIIQYKNYLSGLNMLDEIIATGDLVKGSSSEASSATYFENFWYNTPGTEDILIAIGNHEWYAQGAQPHGKISISEADQLFFQDASNWGITRETGKPYYYKDYADKGIRLIVTDPAIQNEADETTWLVATLAGAKTLGYSVIVASHYLMLNNSTEIKSATIIDNDWTNNETREEQTITMNYDWTGSCDIVKCVTDFIADGGSFLCYIVGHWHWDILSYPTGHPEQLIITIAAATPDREQTKLTSNDLPRYADTRTQDAFNVLTFDAENKIIKCVRVGSNMNMYEQPRTAFAYDVANHQFISVI